MTQHLSKDSIIPDDYQGQRLDFVLARLFPDYSRSQLQNWLKEGFIKVNNSSPRAKDKVKGGELVQLDLVLAPLNLENQAEAIPLNIVFEDEHLLVINKPAGLVVHPGAGNRQHTLLNALLHHHPDLNQLPRAGIVHRLDKDTTGLLLIAKTLEAHTHLIRQMQEREIDRHYQALVYGHLIAGGVIETAYGRHPRNRLKMAVCMQGKLAITHYTIRRQYQQFTLLDITLMTGRTHQIRVHMAHILHPVVGDPLYGGRMRYPAGISAELREQIKQFQRQALHACKLSFFHPVSAEHLVFHAELPADFQALLTTLDSPS